MYGIRGDLPLISDDLSTGRITEMISSHCTGQAVAIYPTRVDLHTQAWMCCPSVDVDASQLNKVPNRGVGSRCACVIV